MSNDLKDLSLQLESEIVRGESKDEVINLEPVLHNHFDDSMRELYFCMPAIITNVQNIQELRVDVKPLNKIRNLDNTITELPTITNVPFMCYGTDDSAILINPKQGQTVLLMFTQLSLDEFKGGSIIPYSAFSNRKFDIQDAVVIPSIFPFNRSPNNVDRHYTNHSTDDLTVVHNLGTSKENKVILKRSGSISITAPKSVDIDAPQTTISENLSVGKLLNVGEDVVIAGRSLVKYMDTHNHNYTDDGKPMATAPANPI